MENVLFLCTGNYVRSILAEAVTNHVGADRYRAFSAGSNPHRSINPDARKLLREHGFATEGLRSKHWREFLTPDAPRFDYVITVCDSVTEGDCPTFPGQPKRARWCLPDPCAGHTAPPTREAVDVAFREVRMLVSLFVRAPASVTEALHIDPVAFERSMNEYRDRCFVLV